MEITTSILMDSYDLNSHTMVHYTSSKSFGEIPALGYYVAIQHEIGSKAVSTTEGFFHACQNLPRTVVEDHIIVRTL
jgi:hypothetical protein